jgi:hypothetical protein
MRHSRKILMLLTLTAVAGCRVVPTTPIAEGSPQSEKITAAIAQWPKVDVGLPGLKRPFFATIHISGRRITASGILDYHSHRDFRITAVSELGLVLFDARMNWAGVTVLRRMPELPKVIVQTFVEDMSLIFKLPATLKDLVRKGDEIVLERTEDGSDYRWSFNPSTGRLMQTEVDRGFADKLIADFRRYTDQGWPDDFTVTRQARGYSLSLTFSDGSLAQKPVR